MTTEDLVKIAVSLGLGGLLSEGWKRYVNKKKENTEIDNMWRQGRELDVKFSSYINDLVEKKANEKTQELRNYIAESEIKHYKEKQEQGQEFAKRFTQLESEADRKIKVLEMKVDVIQRNFDKKMEVMQGELNKEIDLRTQCMKRLQELEKKQL